MRLFLTICLLISSSASFAQAPTMGTLSFDVGATDGYTLLTPNLKTQSYLLDNCGRVIKSWNSNYFPGLSSYFHTDSKLYRSARISDPNLPAAAKGGRFERFNWQGFTDWTYEYYDSIYTPHHDFVVLPNGNLIVIVLEEVSDSTAWAWGKDPQTLNYDKFWIERLVELRPIIPDSAEIVWEWNVMDHLIQDFDSTQSNYGNVGQHPELVDINYSPDNQSYDWLHINAIDYNERLDQIVLSVRDLNEVWVLDHSTTTAEAATHSGGNNGKGGDILYRWGNPESYRAGGPNDQVYFGQHDAQWVDDSLIMVYNNANTRGYSSVDLISPPLLNNGTYPLLSVSQAYPPTNLSWTYPLDSAFSSGRLSSAQRLENGHTFICSGNLGYFREINTLDTTVWEYLNPLGATGTGVQGQTSPINNQVFMARKYAANDPRFSNLNISPQAPLELNPSLSFCNINSNLVVNEKPLLSYKIIPNPTNKHRPTIQIISDNFIEQFSIFNIVGEQLLFQTVSPTKNQEISIQDLVPGLYFIQLNKLHTQKLIIAH